MICMQSPISELTEDESQGLTNSFVGELGKGTFGSTHCGTYNGRDVAIKLYDAYAAEFVIQYLILICEHHNITNLSQNSVSSLSAFYSSPYTCTDGNTVMYLLIICDRLRENPAYGINA